MIKILRHPDTKQTEDKAIDKKEVRKKKVTIELPPSTIDGLRKAAKEHYRSFNGELIFGLEQYLMHLWNDANNIKHPK